MTITTSALPNFEQALRDHGLALPQAFEVVLLPRRALSGVAEDWQDRDSESATLRKILSGSGFATSELAGGKLAPGIRIQKSSDLLIPAILVYQFLVDDPARFKALIDALASYILERLQKPAGNVRFQIVLQQKGPRYREVTYDGPASGISGLERVLRELSDG